TVKKESGFSNKILRPLCAKNLESTEMELNGLIDREKLLDIAGRSRTKQIELAKQWNIKDYPSPAGGCKLTEPNYAIRLQDLLQGQKEVTVDDLEILKLGRHLRISNSTKAIVSRNAEEEEKLKAYIKDGDLILMAKNSVGAMVLTRGANSKEDLEIAASICGRYCKEKDNDNVEINCLDVKSNCTSVINITPYKDEDLKEYMINF
ncbi:MAG: tRNA 4-thiouridine(8) synthase ThiI, partial [Sarcina sp.]